MIQEAYRNYHLRKIIFFLQTVSNMLKNTFTSELDKDITIYGSISYFEKTKENKKVYLITTRHKLNFAIAKEVYKEKIKLELAKGSSQSTMHTTINAIKHFGILSTKKDKRIGQKENTMSYELY